MIKKVAIYIATFFKQQINRNKIMNKIVGILALLVFVIGCEKQVNTSVIKPAAVTEIIPHDTDDPAIWINPEDPSKSLIIGTDKDDDGALYVYDLGPTQCLEYIVVVKFFS